MYGDKKRKKFFFYYVVCIDKNICVILTETTGFTFRFQETEDIVFTNGTLDVTDDGTVGIVHEFNADLSDTTTRTGTTENLSNSGKLDGSLGVGILSNHKGLVQALFLIFVCSM